MQKRLWHSIIVPLLSLLTSLAWGVSVGDVISNTAQGSYSVSGYTHTVYSNEVNQTVVGTTAEIVFMTPTSTGGERHPVGVTRYLGSDNRWHTMPSPQALGDSRFSLNRPEQMRVTTRYREDSVAIVKVSDADQNRDSTLRETIDINITSPSGDIERLRLIETTPNSGIFVGYLLLASTEEVPMDGRLHVDAGDKVTAFYGKEESATAVDSVTIVAPDQDYNVWIEIKVNKAIATIGESLYYTLIVHNDEKHAVDSMTIDNRLPLGITYIAKTATVDGKAVSPSATMQKSTPNGKQSTYKISPDGKHIYFPLPTIPANGSVTVTYIADLGAGVHGGKVVNTATVVNDVGFVSNTDRAVTRIREEMMRSEGIIIGQVYVCHEHQKYKEQGVGGVTLYMEDGTYVTTDKAGRYHFEGVEAGTHVVQIDSAMLPDGYEVSHAMADARLAGRALSQFVDVGRGALKRVDFCLKRKANLKHATHATSTVSDLYTYTKPTHQAVMPHYSSADLHRYEGRGRILWPPEKFVPSIPSIKIAIAHDKHDKAQVWLNDQKVSMLNFDGRVSDHNSSTVIDTYKGVDLLNGTNTIRVTLHDRANHVKEVLKRTVHVTGAPAKIEYVEAYSYTVADGKHNPVIAVRFLDADGYPLRSGITGTFSIESPYRSQTSIESEQDNPLSATRGSEDRFVIDSKGIAYIKLQPTTQAGTVSLHFKIDDRDEVIRAWLKPQMRQWVMVGFAEGTIGYNTLKGHRENLKEVGAKKGIVKEGRVSFFAQGSIKGSWLLTLAYDSGKDAQKSPLFKQIDPNAYYTLYNDATTQNHGAPSRKKLYVKVEKEHFSALYGDFSTDMSVTELARYSRRLTGIKGEYHDTHIEAKAFLSETDQLFIRDDIRADGTSGYYYLSKHPLLPNSESIEIEVRDRYHPERVLSRRTLHRFRDYEIAYDRGRMRFREPIYATDTHFNPRYIVVKYEIEGDGRRHYTTGGRLVGKVLDEKVQVGVSYISEDNVKQQSKLYGIDSTLKIGSSTTLKAEYAKSKTTEGGKQSEGDAKYAEMEYLSKRFHLRGYFREEQESFGLGQLSESLGATRQLGVELSKTFDNRLLWKSSAFRNSDLATKSHQDVFESNIVMQQTLWSASMGYRYAKHTTTAVAHQMTVGADRAFFDQRLKLSIAHDQSFGEDRDKRYPSKTVVGATVALGSKVDLIARYEWLYGDKKQELGRLGMRYRPWSGMQIENTTTSAFHNDTTRIYNTLGMLQGYQLNEAWGLSVGYERGELLDGNHTLNDTEDFVAYRLGVNYRADGWSGRVSGEYRDASEAHKYNLTGAIYTQPNSKVALALGASYNHERATTQKSDDANLRLSIAYRPQEGATTLLEKLDLVYQGVDGAEDGTTKTQKVVNNLLVNYTPTPRTELSLQHGIKYVKDRLNTYELTGITQLFGMDSRYDITKKWMVGVQGSLLYAMKQEDWDYGVGLYIGYNLFTNMLIVSGYNWEGFEDRDFSLQNYRIEGPYVQFRMKFDQKDLKAVVRWLSW